MKTILVGLIAVGLAAGAVAEQNPPQPPVPPGGAPQGPVQPDGGHRDMRAYSMRFGGMDESARILPPGGWWKDQELAKRIELTSDQQKRIDDIFLQSKITLIHMHASLEEEEVLLGPMLDANPIDQGKVLAQISKIADTRADLEKANAKMLLQVRGVLSQQQWTKLQQERPHGMRQHMFGHAPDGPRSWNMPMPGLDSLREQFGPTPPVNMAKLKAQIDAAMLDRPRIDTKRLGDLLQRFDPAPPVDEVPLP